MKYWIIFFISLAANTLFANEGLLWQIDKPGHTSSYLFATIHSEDPRVTQLPPIVRSRFEHANSLSLEMLMDKKTQLTIARRMFFTGKQTLDQLIDKKLFAQIVKAMRQHYIPEMLVKKLKPWAVIAMISVPPMKTGEILDLLLYKKAQKLQIPIYGLETAEEQLAIFESFSLAEQILMLKESLKDLNDMPALFEKMHELYLQRNLTALMKFGLEDMQKRSENKPLANAFYKRILDDRNIIMLERMEKRLDEGNAFIAVGALHLPGTQGLLNLLQARGYKISVLY